jgi:hypothetical protein
LTIIPYVFFYKKEAKKDEEGEEGGKVGFRIFPFYIEK